jgi:hypothetical protein
MNQLTVQQNLIVDTALAGNSLAVRAYAGSGKTSTSLEVLTKTNAKTKAYISFGRANADSINAKLGVEDVAFTVHARLIRTLTTLTKCKISEGRDHFLVKSVLDYHLKLDEKDKGYWQTLAIAKEMLHYAIVTQSTDFNSLCETFGIVPSELAMEAAKVALERCTWSMHKYGLSFDGLVHYFASDPSKLALLPKYDLLVVDECQDLSPALRTIIGSMRHENTTVLALGDPMQSIYGFAGADESSYYKVRAEFCNDVELPMSTSFRVPQEHLPLIADIVPEMECAFSGGEVLEGVDYADLVNPGNKYMVLGRTGSQLVSEHTRLRKLGVTAAINDSSLKDKIVKAVKAVNPGRDYRFELTLTNLEAHFDGIIESIKARKGKSTKWVDDLRVATEEMVSNAINAGVSTKAAFEDYANLVFTEDLEAADAVLGTIHKAKGGEATNVAMLNYSELGEVAQSLSISGDDENPDTVSKNKGINQEKNIKYVGLTRSTKTLVLR